MKLRSFIPATVWIVVIIVLCLMPGDDLPEKGLFNIPHIDKIAHFGLYIVLALLMIFPLKNRQLPVIPVVMFLSAFLGGGLEILQHYFTETRSGSWIDLLADILGAFSGIALFLFFSRRAAKNLSQNSQNTTENNLKL